MSRTHKDARKHVERLARRFDCPELIDLCCDEKCSDRPRMRRRKVIEREAELFGIETPIPKRHFQYSWG